MGVGEKIRSKGQRIHQRPFIELQTLIYKKIGQKGLYICRRDSLTQVSREAKAA